MHFGELVVFASFIPITGFQLVQYLVLYHPTTWINLQGVITSQSLNFSFVILKLRKSHSMSDGSLNIQIQ